MYANLYYCRYSGLSIPNLVCGSGANLTCATTSAQICASASINVHIWTGYYRTNYFKLYITMNARALIVLLLQRLPADYASFHYCYWDNNLPNLQCGSGLISIAASPQLRLRFCNRFNILVERTLGIVGSNTASCIMVNAPVPIVLLQQVSGGITQIVQLLSLKISTHGS
jgi:hypothetical protein